MQIGSCVCACVWGGGMCVVCVLGVGGVCVLCVGCMWVVCVCVCVWCVSVCEVSIESAMAPGRAAKGRSQGTWEPGGSG